MEHRYGPTLLGFFAVFVFLSSIKPARAIGFTQSYCSSLNTGSDDQVYTWPYQSNGNCTNHCKEEGTYAFAVLQYTDCWCSNYAPGEEASMDDCRKDCPGFPDEKCGNKDKNLFMYIQMDGQVSGTIGGSQPTSSAAEPSETKAEPTQAPTTEKPSPTQSSQHDDEPTSAMQPVTTPTVVTESGRIVTKTVVFTPTAAASETGSSDSKSNVGAIAGGVAGGVIALLAVVGGILFVLWRKRRQQDHDHEGHGNGSAGISRNVSTMSRAGLLGGRGEKSPSQLVTTFGSQRSRHDDESITPVTPSTRRLSQPILVDSRLNPTAVLTFHGANASRESLGSIDDSRDYGRQLNVRNPDPN
jgi:cell wall integrity and stress response component